MRNIIVDQKIILLMLLTVFLICGIQGISYGGGVAGAIGDAAGAVGGALGTALGIVVDVVAGTVQIAAGVLDLSVRLVATFVWHTDSLSNMTVVPNGGLIGVAFSNLIQLRDPHFGTLHATLTHDSPVNSIAFNPDGSLLASGSGDNVVRLWIPDTETLQATLHGHTASVLSVAFSSDGSLLASGSADGTVRLWNPHTETLQATLHGHTASVLSVAFSSDGSLLASGSADGTVRLWNLVTETLQATLEAHMDSVLSVAFSLDGLLLASASADGLVGLWDPHTETLQVTLGHESPVLSIAFSPDGDFLATGSTDGTARLWDPHMVQLKATLGHESPVESVAFDGSMLVTGSQDGRVRQWEITTLTAPPSSSQNDETPRNSDSQPEGLAASTAAPLTEATIDGSVVTLRVTGGIYKDNWNFVNRNVKVSGIAGVTFSPFNLDIESDTEITVELDFNGTDFDANSTLTFTVEPEAMVNYTGSALTAQISVTALTESVVATTAAPLTEATLDGSVVTLTLSGRTYESSIFTIRDAVTVSGITGVTVGTFGVDRVSDTQITVELTFDGNINTDSTLTFTVGADAIVGGYNGSALTAQVSVSAGEAPVEQVPDTPEQPEQPEGVGGTPTLSASTAAPLTEATLDESVVTLTLSGRTYEQSNARIRTAVTISGIAGVTARGTDIDRVSDTQVTVELTFDRNINTDGTLTFTVGAGAIADYNGSSLTTQIPVTAVAESVVATTAAPLTEATLDESVVTLALNSRSYESSRFTIRDAVTVSGIAGVTVGTFGVDRVSDTTITVELTFDGNINTNGTLTFTVGADAIARYNGPALTAQVSVSAGDPPVVQDPDPPEQPITTGGEGETPTLSASTAAPLTEATLHESVVTLILSGRVYEDSSYTVALAITVSGIDGATFETWDVDRISDTEVTVELTFDGDFDTDATLTVTVEAGAIAGYSGPALTAQISVTGGPESIVASTTAPLTEATLHESVVTLTLSGRVYEDSSYTVALAITVSGIDGATFETWDVDRISDTEVTVELTFNGDFDTDATLTVTVEAGAIAGYGGSAFTAHIPVTGGTESLVASTAAPLTEATLHESVVTLTLSGRVYEDSSYTVALAITVSGIDGATFETWDVDRVSDTKVTVELEFDGNIDTDAALTFTVGADAIAGYNGPALTAQVPVTATEQVLRAPSGISLMHVPLQVTAVDGVAQTIESVGDLYNALGGMNTVNLLITHNPKTQEWHSYLGEASRGTSADTILTDNQGIIADMKTPVSLQLDGDAFGSNGSSFITLHPGTNLVGVPLRDSRITHVSDLLALEGIGGNVSAITVSNNGSFQTVEQAGNAGDIPITGGQSFILNARETATVAISGQGWDNVSGVAATTPMKLMGIEVGDTTPILALTGSIVSPVGEWGRMPHLPTGSGFRVIVKNLSTGRAVATMIGNEGNRYQLTIVDTATGRAAQIGDILEISVRSLDPRIGVHPLRHTVTPEDVKWSRVEFGNLIAYEIPTETALLPNYPNPFNPETWIPYRLAEDAFVTLTIYDGNGQVVRTLEIGHRVAAIYESRSKAIYWDGRNEFGEQVASGVYFYHLSAGDFSATRKMLIIK